MDDHGVQGIGGARDFAERSGEHEAPTRPPPAAPVVRETDRVDLTAPEVAALAVLRQRVLVRTKEALELTDVPAHPRFHEPAHLGAGAFLGRLFGEQSQLASVRDGAWDSARIHAALRQGMTSGVEDTLDMLCELGQLDEVCWRLLSAILDAWSTKVSSVEPDSTLLT